MAKRIVALKDCRFEVLTKKDAFLGLGKVWIGKTLVRSGRLPLTPTTQAFPGAELAGLTLIDVVTTNKTDFFPMIKILS